MIAQRVLLERLAAIIAARAKHTSSRLVVGLCGAQGSGKSTLAAQLQEALTHRDVRVAVLSLDDLYLTRAQRATLAKRVHPLLGTRGVPGTHDLGLALSVLQDLDRPGRVLLPSFDKARDDRRPVKEWRRVVAPIQVLLLEGWCVGAVAQSPAALAPSVNDLEREEDPDGRWRRYVNDCLSGPYRSLFSKMDLLILLAAPGFDVVLRWRTEQEEQMRQQMVRTSRDLTRVMSPKALQRFISHFERLTEHILAEMPSRADIVVQLNGQRRVIKVVQKGVRLGSG